MLPIGPLMREHRLIERMVEKLKKEIESIKKGNVNTVFIDTAVDFFRTYADRTHHGKEEDILFKELKKKKIAPELEKIIDELIQEHTTARNTVRNLIGAKDRYLKGDKNSIKEIENIFSNLIELYPTHIEKEDKKFFYPVMDYFSIKEKEAMLQKFYEFDRNMIHEKYGGIVDTIRKQTRNGESMRCIVCGYVYDPSVGDEEHEIKAGTLFEELPDDWVCPVCFAAKKLFEKVE